MHLGRYGDAKTVVLSGLVAHLMMHNYRLWLRNWENGHGNNTLMNSIFKLHINAL